MQRTEGGGDQWLFEKIKVFLTNQKHEPNIVEITHLCIMHGAHTSESKHNIIALVGKANKLGLVQNFERARARHTNHVRIL
jgi:hypothetical protein